MKIKIGNLNHDKKKCNCGQVAEYYIFLLREKKRSIFYKCGECMNLINNIASTIDLITKN